MYAGKITELGPTREVLNHPKHPYTVALFQAVPDVRRKQLIPPVGEVPSLVDLPVGCRYNTRCPLAKEKCKVSEPPTIVSDKVEVACWLYE
jgi:peptide/nickel transport system ATP-binding protein